MLRRTDRTATASATSTASTATAPARPVPQPQHGDGGDGGGSPQLSMPSPLGLTARNVTQVFGARGKEPVVALEDFSLDVAPGEFVAVVGPSGCGKTTLLRTFAGLAEPTTGEVSVGGEPLRKPRRDVSMMFQAPTLLPWKTVLGNCLLPREIDHRVDDRDRARAHELLAWAGLDGFADRRPHELSGGMQQRVAICRALMADPAVLLLDEPFGALDAMTREQMNVDMRRIWSASGVTTLLITHDIPEAVFLAQRVVVLSSRPGRTLDVIDVPLPRERDIAVVQTPEFAATCGRIRSYFIREGSHAAL
ncbi:NitT/TauT family transport system ATP-binding protein [Streptomyces sp. Amel2xB2]|uniref:ABC transporter ATP-binding protein n=1 Tax=Streptomyces sp. Amel2xB2 TaxID=1305829 RepID=UPI000DBFBBF7|nr:ABC transporter ATP-binding protein [Streptomyces sp. Amel2xB2]RAJ59079.1 NitT/TauT family transport system ATP-binding protein [Streptomyces sp. Amel2xB2]